MQRPCDFEERRKHLQAVRRELKERFWFRTKYQASTTWLYHTSPSIERSVLLRMGFSSLEAQSIVSSAEKRGLLGKGAGNIVLTFAKARGIDYLQAGKQLASGSGWDEVVSLFGGVASQ